MKSTVYALMRLNIEHSSDVDPLDVVREVDCKFSVRNPQGETACIADTEIVAVVGDRPSC
jgi:hypothetical protein